MESSMASNTGNMKTPEPVSLYPIAPSLLVLRSQISNSLHMRTYKTESVDVYTIALYAALFKKETFGDDDIIIA